MKFYKRFPGDITIKTGDLNLTEFGAYDRLLDHYYSNESPIDPERVYTVARAQSASDRRAVDKVLLAYWTLTPLGWVQQRADEMIAEALPAIEAARENGKKGGRPSKAKLAARAALIEPAGLLEGSFFEPDEKASQSQNQNGSEAKASAAADASAAVDKSTNTEPPAIDRRWLWETAKALLVEAGSSEASAREFMGSLVKDFTETVAHQAVKAASAASPRPIDPKAWLIATCKALKAKTIGQYETAEQTRARLDADAERHAAQDPEKVAAAVAAARESSQRLKAERATGTPA